MAVRPLPIPIDSLTRKRLALFLEWRIRELLTQINGAGNIHDEQAWRSWLTLTFVEVRKPPLLIKLQQFADSNEAGAAIVVCGSQRHRLILELIRDRGRPAELRAGAGMENSRISPDRVP